MEAIIYITIFIIGTLFGSFFTLATYRIPLGQDITHKRSYCPNCNHRLEFLDMIPIFSYIFLGGKCRYCKQKIKPRYLLFEIFSGLTFLFFALSLKLDIFRFNINIIAYLVYGLLYISTLFLIAGRYQYLIVHQSYIIMCSAFRSINTILKFLCLALILQFF